MSLFACHARRTVASAGNGQSLSGRSMPNCPLFPFPSPATSSTCFPLVLNHFPCWLIICAFPFVSVFFLFDLWLHRARLAEFFALLLSAVEQWGSRIVHTLCIIQLRSSAVESCTMRSVSWALGSVSSSLRVDPALHDSGVCHSGCARRP